MIDAASYKKHIRFIVQHYGTNTQGEDYRYDQVATYLTELMIRTLSYTNSMEEVRECYPNDMPATFRLSI